MCHSLITATGLLKAVETVRVTHSATLKDAMEYHSESYLKALFQPKNTPEELENFGLTEDAVKFKGAGQHALWILQSSLTACDEIIKCQGQPKVAVNW